MKKLTCIVCPNGCDLLIDDNLNVSGNLCNRGKEFAIQELSHPKRVLTASIKTVFEDMPVVSCKSDGEIDKELLMDAMEILKHTIIKERLKMGSVVIENILNTNVNVITTKNM